MHWISSSSPLHPPCHQSLQEWELNTVFILNKVFSFSRGKTVFCSNRKRVTKGESKEKAECLDTMFDLTRRHEETLNHREDRQEDRDRDTRGHQTLLKQLAYGLYRQLHIRRMFHLTAERNDTRWWDLHFLTRLHVKKSTLIILWGKSSFTQTHTHTQIKPIFPAVRVCEACWNLFDLHRCGRGLRSCLSEKSLFHWTLKKPDVYMSALVLLLSSTDFLLNPLFFSSSSKQTDLNLICFFCSNSELLDGVEVFCPEFSRMLCFYLLPPRNTGWWEFQKRFKKLHVLFHTWLFGCFGVRRSLRILLVKVASFLQVSTVNSP